MLGLLDRVISFFEWVWRFFTAQGVTGPKYDPHRMSRLRWGIRIFLASVSLLLVFWFASLLWLSAWDRGYDLAYPQKILRPNNFVPADETTGPETGRVDVQSCDESELVEMSIYLINHLIEENAFLPALPQYKSGIFWLVDWEDTPFFDNKAAFQRGVLQAIRRTTIELVDSLGRVRGTSGEDRDLLTARGHLNFDDKTWGINLFDPERATFSTVTSAGTYQRAVTSLTAYNNRLSTPNNRGQCGAIFDARADNLRQLLVRISSHIGGVVDQLSKRSQGVRYDPALDQFVDGTGSDAGWFDFKGDNFFYEASGMMYAYHGLLQAIRVDFESVIEKRDLADIWDLMETHVAEAAALSPFIVSNGREDGVVFPDHLSALSENILRARANMVEARDILVQ